MVKIVSGVGKDWVFEHKKARLKISNNECRMVTALFVVYSVL